MNCKTIKAIFTSSIIILLSLLFTGCNDDDNPVDTSGSGNENAILITRVDEGVSYIQALDIAAASGTVSQSDATQIMSDWAFIWSYGGYAYVSGYDLAELSKYSITSDGSVNKEGALAIPADAWLAGTAFVSDTKAYYSLYHTGRVVVFNPTTMAEIATINLTPYAVEGYAVSPANMIIQGNRLLVALHQMKGMMEFDFNAHVVIIDTEADTVIAHITDPRGSWTASRESVPGMLIDDNDDVYIACSALFGMAGAAPEGVLRIKSGAVEFDPDYHWDVSATAAEGEPPAAVGQNVALYALAHVGGTKGIGIVLNMAYMGEGEDMMTGHYMKPVEIDFVAKTMKVLDIPAGGGYGHGVGSYGNKFLFASEIYDGNGVYEYDPATGQTELLFTSNADPCYIVEIQE